MSAEEKLDQLLRFLEGQNLLRQVQSCLRSQEGPSGRSFDEIARSLKADPQSLDTALPVLEQCALDAATLSNKDISIVQVGEEVTAACWQAEPSAALPSAVADALATRPELPSLVGVRDLGTMRFFIYSVTRRFRDKVEIEREWLQDEFRNQLPADARAYSVTDVEEQCFDFVAVVRDTPYVVVGVTATELGRRLVDPLDDSFAALDSSFGTTLGLEWPLGTPVDLFPAIRRIYDDGDEGRVVELHFECSAGAIRAEKMRRTSEDLRQEGYHVAGVEVSEIDPYRIGVRWTRDDRDVELFLPGVRRMLRVHEARPQLLWAYLKVGLESSDFQFVVDKLLSLSGAE